MKLDAIYLKILDLLQRHGRLSNAALADRVGLSPSPCLERLRKLEARHLIARYMADIDLDRLGPSVHILADIRLVNHDVEDFQRFEAAIAAIDEVVSCYKLAGPYDYTLDLVCRDIPHFNAVRNAMIGRALGIDVFRGHVVLERTKPFSGYPLAVLTDEG